MKVILYVFSGTGNTLGVANLYKKYLEAARNSCAANTVDIHRISKKSGQAPAPENYDLVGFGYPIHAFCAPEPFINFCKSLPSVNNKPAFIFKTSGEGLHINDASSQKSVKILLKKGYDILTERHIVMPYNMIYRHNDAMAKHMWIYARALADLHCREIIAKKREKVRKFYLKSAFTSPVGFIERHFSHLHGRVFKVDAKKCISCGKCVQACPENNITVNNGKYKFGSDCVLCMGCSFGCPRNAIKIGLFKYWKVNGSYRLNELITDEALPFPYIPDHAKGIYRIYKKYYREADKKLKKAEIDINNYIKE